jgi:branched-subunit amino acid transport protein
MILLAGAITFSHRASFIMLGSRLKMPPVLRRSLAYIPPAVLAAIVAPALLVDSGVAVGPFDVRLIAMIGAGVVAWRVRSLLVTFVTGMALLWLLVAIFG